MESSSINNLFSSSSMNTTSKGAMEFYRSNRLVSILSDSIKIVAKNMKLIVFVVFLSVSLSAICVLFFAYSVQSPVRGIIFATRSYSSSGPRRFDQAMIARLFHHLRKDGALLFVLEVAFILALSIISFFSTVSTILISTVVYNAKKPSLKELFLMIKRSWTRPLVTSLYISGLSIAYFLVVFMFAAPLWIYPDLLTFWLGVMIMIPSFVLYSYLQVPWILSVVVVVAEENFYGLEALGRAATLVKGKRMHGFLLNVIHSVLVLIIFQFYWIKMGGKELATIRFILVMGVSYLVKILFFVAYTVFYFQCKMHDGEEIQLRASMQYTKLDILP